MSQATAESRPTIGDALEERAESILGRKRRSLVTTRIREAGIYFGLICCGLFSLLITVSIVFVLLVETIQFFKSDEVTIGNFIGSAQWTPLLGATKSFGIWGLVSGTLLGDGDCHGICDPVRFDHGDLPERVCTATRAERAQADLGGVGRNSDGCLRILCAHDDHAVSAVGARWLQCLQRDERGIAVGILCFPTVCSLAEDALQAVPNTLRDGALGLGGTRFDATVKVILPAALSGIVSAFLLAIARAIGETMIVALAAGSRPQATIDPRNEIQTMTGFMVQMAGGDVSNFGTEYFSMYAVAFTLFIMTLSLTMIGNLVRKRFRETYE